MLIGTSGLWTAAAVLAVKQLPDSLAPPNGSSPGCFKLFF